MMVHGQNGAHLSESLLRNKLEGYTQGKGRGLTPRAVDGGELRNLQTFFWLQVFSAPKQSPRPPRR